MVVVEALEFVRDEFPLKENLIQQNRLSQFIGHLIVWVAEIEVAGTEMVADTVDLQNAAAFHDIGDLPELSLADGFVARRIVVNGVYTTVH